MLYVIFVLAKLVGGPYVAIKNIQILEI